jgi:hypothetical protein
VLKKINFQTAMEANNIKYVKRDTVYKLFMKVIEGWRRTSKTGGGKRGRGGVDFDSDSSDWSDSDEDSDLNENLDSSATSEWGCVRTSLCTILKNAVLPMASGRFAQMVATPTLEDLYDDGGLLLTPLDFDVEKDKTLEIGVDQRSRRVILAQMKRTSGSSSAV